MKNPSLSFRLGPYFPATGNFAGILLLIFGLAYLGVQPVVGIGFILLGITPLTCHYRLYIDGEAKEYAEYFSIWGFNIGERKKFERLEYIFIRPNRITQTMRLRAVSTTVRTQVFDAYLRVSDKVKIHLKTHKNLETLLTKIRPVAEQLGLEIRDLSQAKDN